MTTTLDKKVATTKNSKLPARVRKPAEIPTTPKNKSKIIASTGKGKAAEKLETSVRTSPRRAKERKHFGELVDDKELEAIVGAGTDDEEAACTFSSFLAVILRPVFCHC